MFPVRRTLQPLRLNILFVLWLFLQHLYAVAALKGDSWCGLYVCVNATVNGPLVTYEMTALVKQVGWVAVGFGPHMINTELVIMWRNKSNSSAISQRITTGYVEPRPELNPRRRATVNENPTVWGNPDYIRLAFNIPVNTTQRPANDTSEHYIWAMSRVRPNSGDPYETLQQHYNAGYFQLDLTKDLPGSPPSEEAVTTQHSYPHMTHEQLITFHGALVSIGFLILLPLGSLVARWGRSLTPHWLNIHWAFNMVLGLPIITIGWILGPVAVAHQGATHFLDAHQVCGIILYALFLVQIFLGRFVGSRPAGRTDRAHPPSNILHIVLGLLIVFLAFFQTRSGLKEWENATGRPLSDWFLGLWTGWVVILPLIYFVGCILIPRQLAQERSGIPVVIGRYTPLSNGSTRSRLPKWLDIRTIFAVSEDGSHEVYTDARGSSAEIHELEGAVPLLHAQEQT